MDRERDTKTAALQGPRTALCALSQACRWLVPSKIFPTALPIQTIRDTELEFGKPEAQEAGTRIPAPTSHSDTVLSRDGLRTRLPLGERSTAAQERARVMSRSFSSLLGDAVFYFISIS